MSNLKREYHYRLQEACLFPQRARLLRYSTVTLFAEVAGFVYIVPQLDGKVIGEQLQRDDVRMGLT